MNTPILSHIKAENWQGTELLSYPLDAFTLFCGPNGAGKTRLLEGINFAMFGRKPRGVGKLADLPVLLTHGEETGFFEVGVLGRDVRRSVKTGNLLGKVALPALPDAAEWILSPTTFSDRSEEDRRRMLSSLLEVKTTPDAIAERLLAQGLPERVVADLKPKLQLGFAATEKRAKERASEARGSWQTITGANYGSKVAEDWAPPEAHAPTPETLAENEAALTAVRADINATNQSIGASTRALDPGIKEGLELAAGKTEAYRQALTRGEVQRHEVAVKLDGFTALASGGNEGTTTPCPHCNELVIIDRGELRKPTEEAVAQVRADAARQVVDLRAALAKIDEGLEACRAGIRAGEAAQVRLDANKELASGKDPAELRELLVKLQARESSLQALVTMQRSQRAAADALEGAAAKAKAEHQAVQDYTKAAELLSANGIPSILVAQVLDPVNGWLLKAAEGMGSPRIVLDSEMVLWYGPTPYAQASEGEQWRCDAAMAYALANLAKLPVLLLDRVDVIDHSDRGRVLAWLHMLAHQQGWQVVAGATLKAAPSVAGITAYWLERAHDRAAA